MPTARGAGPSVKGHAGRVVIPVEVLDLIFFYTDARSLSGFLRASKLFCQVAAPHLYRHITITPQTDMLFDSGLPLDILTRMLPIGTNDRPARDRTRAAATSSGGPATLKRSFLAMIVSVDLVYAPTYEHHPFEAVLPPHGKRNLARERYAKTLGETVIGKWLASLPPVVISCEHLKVHLRERSHDRDSPLKTSFYSTPRLHILPFLAVLQPRRLILQGAGFHQTSDPMERLDFRLFQHIHEVVVVVTAGPPLPPVPATQTREASLGVGLTAVLSAISRAFQLVDNDPKQVNLAHPEVDITMIIESPNPHTHFPPIVPEIPRPPGLPGRVDPRAAPGWLHNLACVIGERVGRYRVFGRLKRGDLPWPEDYYERVEGARTMRNFRLVNFGCLDGSHLVPCVQAGDMQDIIERGLRWLLGKTRRGMPENEDAQGGWLRFMGMKEWIREEEAEGRKEPVLSKEVMNGWS